MTREIRTGDAASCEVEVTEAMVRAFAELTGDVNPLHVDPVFAEAHGFRRPVAHGLLTLGAISRLIGTELPGPGALWMAQTLQFARPVFVGDTVAASVAVEQVSNSTGVIVLKTEGRLARTGELVLSGSARVRLAGAAQPDAPGDAAAQEAPTFATSLQPATGRVALVTGGSRGIGAAIAQGLALDGIKIIIHHREREKDAAAVMDRIRHIGGEASVCRADLADGDGADRLFEEAMACYGRIDVLVNNATPPIVLKPVLECTWSDVQRYLDVYVRATLTLAQRAAAGMQERRFGRVINVLSTYAVGAPPPRLAAYVTAKSALAGLSRALAIELGPFGITVNMIAPSTVPTEQTEGLTDRARQLQSAQTPLRRLASVDDVALAARFLASERSAFITGAVLPVAGGTMMQ